MLRGYCSESAHLSKDAFDWENLDSDFKGAFDWEIWISILKSGFPNKMRNPKTDFDERKSFSKTDFN